MADRSVRNLTALSGASTSRVLNLAAIARSRAEKGLPREAHAPLFDSPVINSAILVKHRLRADESYLFPSHRSTATKIIVPFDVNDLACGGRSFFYGQRGFGDALADIGNYSEKQSTKRDSEVLRLIDTIPSLDPFLLREYLKSNDIKVDDCYFEISAADQAKMYEFAATEVRKLIQLATNERGSGQAGSTSRLVWALLSSEVDDTLAPLQATLKLAGDEFREGIFSWRGFLYYKWNMDAFWPQLVDVLREIKAIRPSGPIDIESIQFLTATKNAIIEATRVNGDEVKRVLKIYDDAFAGLIERREPKAFREFLLGAPSMFLELGERMGTMSHITSFWRYRFPLDTPRTAGAEELLTILQDFSAGFGLDTSATPQQGQGQKAKSFRAAS